MEMTHIDPWDRISKLNGYSPEFYRQAQEMNAIRRREALAEQERKRAVKLCRQRFVPQWAIDIIFETARMRNVPAIDICTVCRVYAVVDARHEAIYQVKSVRPTLSSPQIAKWFGVDHTTVLHSLASYAAQTGAPKLTNYRLKTGRRGRASADGYRVSLPYVEFLHGRAGE